MGVGVKVGLKDSAKVKRRLVGGAPGGGRGLGGPHTSAPPLVGAASICFAEKISATAGSSRAAGILCANNTRHARPRNGRAPLPQRSPDVGGGWHQTQSRTTDGPVRTDGT